VGISIALMRNPIQHYAWGSTRHIARLTGRPDAVEPEAEVWIGAHARASSQICVDGEWNDLSLLIGESTGGSILGAATVASFGQRLPFLTKFLAVERPLSVQIHPALKSAEEGYRDEEARDIPLDHPTRSFVDPFDKPEMICALDEMEMLVGFRPAAEIAKDLRDLGLADTAELLESRTPGEAFTALLGAARQTRESILKRLHDNPSIEIPWITEILEANPDDIAVLAPVFLNLVRLRPREAIFVAPGVVHSYLRGFGIEVMGSSDNVLRAGLTSKHISVELFSANLNQEPHPTDVIEPTPDGDGWISWASPAPHFHLSYASLSGKSLSSEGLSILLCTSGSLSISARESEPIALTPGESVFVAHGVAVEITGSGEVYRSAVNATEPTA
jgi:mannose-6-phosphate isomerase